MIMVHCMTRWAWRAEKIFEKLGTGSKTEPLLENGDDELDDDDGPVDL